MKQYKLAPHVIVGDVKIKLPINYDKSHWAVRKQARLQYVLEQNGLCYFCGKPLNEEPAKFVLDAWINWKLFPDTFKQNPIHLHHSHETGMTIGAVHMRCNAYLWQYKGE